MPKSLKIERTNSPVLLKFTGFEIHGFALGILPLRIFRLGNSHGPVQRDFLVKPLEYELLKFTGSHPLNSHSRFSHLTREFQRGGRFNLVRLQFGVFFLGVRWLLVLSGW